MRTLPLAAALALFIVLLGCTPQPPAPPLRGPLAAVLEPIRARHHLPALAAVVVRSDGSLIVDAVGRRSRFDPTAVSAGDQWHLGSNTKAVTATLVARLVEDGRLGWSTTLAELFPDVVERIHPAYRQVTVEMLLAHRAGLPRGFRQGPAWWRVTHRVGAIQQQRLDLVLDVLGRAPAYPPGTSHLYSNAGFVLAGVITERITGRPWEQSVRDSVLAPLGMVSAGFGAPGTPGRMDQPRGHRDTWIGPWPVEPGPRADNPPALGPEGTLHMTLADYGRFLAFHLGAAGARGARAGRPLLQPATLARLHADTDSSHFGLGWGVNRRAWADTVLTHAGSNGFWYVAVWLVPGRFAIAVAANAAPPDVADACEEAARALVKSAQD